MKIFRKTACLLLTTLMIFGSNSYVSLAQDVSSGRTYEEIQVLIGDIQKIATKSLKRVSITDPAIADINDARASSVEIIGLQAGQTVLFIWDDGGKRTVVIRVMKEDMGVVKQRAESLLTSAGISGLTLMENNYEGKVVLTGNLPEEKLDVLKSVIEPLGDRLMNLVQKEKPEDLVQIDIQVTELTTTLTKAMGIDWQAGADDKILFTENLPDTNIPRQNGSFKDLFKLGDFSRTPQLIAAVNALITEGKANVLSKPHLIVVSGKQASFNVGGQIPIRTSTTSDTTTTESVSFKDYGVGMSITPTIENGKMVSIVLNVTISEIDESTTALAGEVAFLTRTAQTELVLEDGQTIALAGMIKTRDSNNTRRIPILGKIPVLGGLFRNTTTAPSVTEVVISITPTILRSDKNKKQYAASLGLSMPAKPEPMKAEAFAKGPDVKFQQAAAASRVFEASEISEPPAIPVVEPVISKVVQSPAAAQLAGQLFSAEAQAYAMSVQQKILSAVAYPYQAQEQGWQGTAKLVLVVQRDGTLRSVVVTESSGYEVFDQDAVNTAQILAPYAAFPVGVESDEMTLTIPIVYSLDGFLKNVTQN